MFANAYPNLIRSDIKQDRLSQAAVWITMKFLSFELQCCYNQCRIAGGEKRRNSGEKTFRESNAQTASRLILCKMCFLAVQISSTWRLSSNDCMKLCIIQLTWNFGFSSLPLKCWGETCTEVNSSVAVLSLAQEGSFLTDTAPYSRLWYKKKAGIG